MQPVAREVDVQYGAPPCKKTCAGPMARPHKGCERAACPEIQLECVWMQRQSCRITCQAALLSPHSTFRKITPSCDCQQICDSRPRKANPPSGSTPVSLLSGRWSMVSRVSALHAGGTEPLNLLPPSSRARSWSAIPSSGGRVPERSRNSSSSSSTRSLVFPVVAAETGAAAEHVTPPHEHTSGVEAFQPNSPADAKLYAEMACLHACSVHVREKMKLLGTP